LAIIEEAVTLIAVPARDHLLRWAALAQPLGPDPLEWRDPGFILGELPLLGALIDRWFAPDVEGLEHLPQGPSLVVGTHNGGTLAPDMFTLMVACWRRFGVELPAYGLAHDQVFNMPVVGRWIARLGAVPARQRNARALLDRGATVLVYPGGDLDAFKPWRERHLVKFGDRTGFIRTAVAAGVPIVPVVSVGAHETVRVLTDGRDLARRLGLKALFRFEVLPVMLCLPWGVWVGAFETHLPAPSKIRIRMLPPIDLGLPPEAAGDEAAVLAARERVRATMQEALDGLVAEGHFGVRARFAELR
jgi:1-acyl-sn-glycerol-3-phosphate acyltransferase